MCSMTSDGSAYSRFRRALSTGNLLLVRAAAAELPRVALRDALEVCLLLRDQDGERFERAAVRWLGRFALEARGATLESLQRAAAAFDAMPRQPDAAMEVLAGLCLRHGVDG
jgi:hypothetical protein